MDVVESITSGDAAGALAALREHPDQAGAVDGSGVSALALACYRGFGEVVEAIRGLRALDLPEAAAVGDVRRVGELLAAGTAVDVRSPDGFSPVQLALFFDHPAAAAVLLRAGADVDAHAGHPMGVAAVHEAAHRGDAGMVELLLAAGADTTRQTDEGHTPADIARTDGHPDLATRLEAAARPT
jgi:ankyrin repeat protein